MSPEKVGTALASLAKRLVNELYILATVLFPVFATHINPPSNASPSGKWPPVAKVPRLAPSQAHSFVTLLEPKFATQIFCPSVARKKWISSHREGTKVGTVLRSPLAHCPVFVVRYPHIVSMSATNFG